MGVVRGIHSFLLNALPHVYWGGVTVAGIGTRWRITVPVSDFPILRFLGMTAGLPAHLVKTQRASQFPSTSDRLNHLGDWLSDVEGLVRSCDDREGVSSKEKLPRWQPHLSTRHV